MPIEIPQVVKDFAHHLSQITDDAERARTLARVKVLAANEAPQEAFEPPIRQLGQYLADPIEVPPVLVEPYVVVRGGLNCTIGRAGKGKTVMNLNRMLRWSAGLPMFDGWNDENGEPMLAPKDPLKILIIENEGAGGLFHRQIGIMLHAEKYLTKEQRELAKENILIWGDGGYSGLKLDDPNKLDGVRRGCDKWEPDIVFIEPFRGLWKGEENSATEMSVVVDAMVGIAADFNCGVLVAHHERKSGVGDDREMMSAGRGSTVLEGAVTVMENFQSVVSGQYRELTWSKSRHGKAPTPVRMEWDHDAWWYKWVSTSDMEESIMRALSDNAGEPMTLGMVADDLGEAQHRVRPVLKRLADDGRIKQMSAQVGPNGSSGHRYRPLSDENNDEFGGLSV